MRAISLPRFILGSQRIKRMLCDPKEGKRSKHRKEWNTIANPLAVKIGGGGREDARKNKKKKKKGNRSRDPRLLSLSRSDRSGIFFFCCRAEEGKD